jgi:aspartate-semialdehyde dehydrogenase
VKIMGDENIKVTATCVRIPTVGGTAKVWTLNLKRFQWSKINLIMRRGIISKWW